MKLWKRTLGLFLLMAVLVLVLPANADAAEVASGTCGDDLTWVLDDAGTLTISGTGAMKTYSSVDDTPWYDYSEEITKVVVESGVTTVSKNAFREFEALKTVSFPSTLTSIGAYAFRECDALTKVTIPAATSVGNYAFYGCKALKNVTVPNIANLGTNAFNSCPKLLTAGPVGGSYNVKFGTESTSLAHQSFAWCNTLTEITVPEGIYNLDERAFYGCNAMTKVVLPETLRYIGDSAFYECASLTEIEIPDGVETIESRAFEGCAGLTAVAIPDSVTGLGSNVFWGCSNLISVDLPDGISQIKGSFFAYCYSLKNVDIPDSVVQIDAGVFTDCTSLTSITLPESIEEIGYGAFNDCASLQYINIPDTVVEISGGLFEGCTSLTYAVIPESAISVGQYAFYDCESLEGVIFLGDAPKFLSDYQQFHNVTAKLYYAVNASGWEDVIGNNYGGNITWVPCIDVGTCGDGVSWALTELGELVIMGRGEMKDYAKASKAPWYDYNEWIESVRVCKGVTRVGKNAFYNYKELNKVTLSTTVKTIGEMSFYGTTGLKSITIPSGVRTVELNAFAYGGLKTVTIKNGVRYFEGNVFMNCPLETVHLPASVRSITGQDFWGCTRLKAITVSADSEYYKSVDGVLYTRDGTTIVAVPKTVEGKFKIPETVETVGWFSFEGCVFDEIVIANSVTKIEGHGFEGCANVTKFVIPDSVEYLGTHAFAYCRGLKTVVFGSGLKEIDDMAFREDTITTAVFTGNAPTCLYPYDPEGGEGPFEGNNVAAYFPKKNYTWTASKRDDFGFYAVWKSYNGAKILTQPSNQKVKTGKNAVFSVEAYGPELTYQWQYKKTSDGQWKNSTASGCKTASMTVSATTAKSGYYFRCVITNKYGEETVTKAVRLYVLGIKTQPTAQKVKAGTNAKFTVSATGANRTYQWQYKTSANGSWKNCTASGCKTASMTVSATTAKSGYYFRCVIKDDAGNKVTTKAVRLYVLGIKTQPTAQKVKAGTTAKFTVSATGAGKTYQWYFSKDGGETWKKVTVASAATATLKISATAAKNGYLFRCVVADNAGNRVTSNSAKLTVK